MSVAADAIVHLIRWYQRHWSAKRAVPCCKFYPSCSHYADSGCAALWRIPWGIAGCFTLIEMPSVELWGH